MNARAAHAALLARGEPGSPREVAQKAVDHAEALLIECAKKLAETETRH